MPGPVTAPDMRSPFSIAGVEIPNRVILAPMAGMTTSAFRRRAKAYGAGLVVTEMVSVYGLVYGDRRTRDYLQFCDEERPLALQLFGADPEAVARAVSVVLETDRLPDLIDLNMGCPVRKVMKTGAGAALLADPARAQAVAAAAVRAAAAAGIPVTAKIRSGLEPGAEVAVEVARRLEHVGVAAIGVHPRAASQFYRGRADHALTRAVTAAVGVPVLASGDVDSALSARAIMVATGASAVMVARGVQAGPWLIADILEGVDRGRRPLPEVAAELRALLELAAADMGSQRAAKWSRKIVGWYLKGTGLSVAERDRLRACADADSLDAQLAEIAAQPSLPPSEGVC